MYQTPPDLSEDAYFNTANTTHRCWSVRETMENLEALHCWRMRDSAAVTENSSGLPLSAENRSAVWPSSRIRMCTSECTPDTVTECQRYICTLTCTAPPPPQNPGWKQSLLLLNTFLSNSSLPLSPFILLLSPLFGEPSPISQHLKWSHALHRTKAIISKDLDMDSKGSFSALSCLLEVK